MPDRQAGLHDLLAMTPVVPVLAIDSVENALPLARALVAGGLPVLEITLRTPAALEIIRAIGGEIEGAMVGAGTVLTPQRYRDAVRAGARFVVSPGATPALLDVAEASSVPFLPGAGTSSEVMRLLERGYGCLKFFPADLRAAWRISRRSPRPCRAPASAQPAASMRHGRRPTWPCPTSSASVALGSPHAMPLRSGTGRRSPGSRSPPQRSVPRRGSVRSHQVDDREQSQR